jgi:putative spermidine/putrescine transport system substrate-binding protein
MDELSPLPGQKSGTTRRQLIGRSAGAVVGVGSFGGLILAACGGEDTGASGDGRPFTLADWGGNTARIRRETWGTAFTEKTGSPTRSTALDYGKFKAQVESKNVSWNWIDAEGWFALGNPDLFIDLPYDKFDIKDGDIYDLRNARTPKAVMSYHSCYAIGHRTDGKGAAPADWVEFFDTKAVPGKRGVFNWPYGTIELALIADGVAYEDLYPLDLDRAFNKFDSIRDDIVFWNSGAESQQMLVSGSADFVQAWHNRVATIADTGAPVDVKWGQNLQIVTHHTISKHQKDPDLCAEFIRTAFEPQALSQYAAASFNSPPTKSAYDMLGDETKKWMSTNPDHLGESVGVIDDEWWGDNLDKVSAAWTEWASA